MSNQLFMMSEDQIQDFADRSFEKAKTYFEAQKDTEQEIPIPIDDATKVVNLTKPTIYGLVHKNKIPYRKKGKRLYFLKSELIAWINSGKRTSKTTLNEKVDDFLFKKRFQ
ncbi:AlpA family transcriptional regulator [Winogradskyella eximia]|uniref:AlpA family transcriptional regulator n=1 Tax=Winogradskyella eximia TaxID=262006 RepID=A0A3D9GZA3_9FLAO|nr:helix-turn-helix domain-containing protein [Winogradskyella eximia]RED42599.1 AlpA family transcriptional regulator [Winogradskyella eximia]